MNTLTASAARHKAGGVVLCLCCGLAAVPGLAGCERPTAGQANAFPLTVSTGQPVRENSDQAITARVKARLAADSELLPMPITVQTAQGTVTLNGRVPQAQIERAVQIVRRVDGVRSVNNQLAPAPLSSPLS